MEDWVDEDVLLRSGEVPFQQICHTCLHVPIQTLEGSLDCVLMGNSMLVRKEGRTE